MAIGKRRKERQGELFVAAHKIRALGNPFYRAPRKMLEKQGFDEFAEETCRGFYAEEAGASEHSARGVFPDADGGILGGARFGAGHRMAVFGLDVAA